MEIVKKGYSTTVTQETKTCKDASIEIIDSIKEESVQPKGMTYKYGPKDYEELRELVRKSHEPDAINDFVHFELNFIESSSINSSF
jgi:hypothetical protein